MQRALPQGEVRQYSVEDSDDTLKLRRDVKRMVDEGTLSKAAKALVSNGIWPRTNDVLLELGRLHNLPIPVDITPQQTIFASEEVLQAALSLLGLRDLDRHIYEKRYSVEPLK